LRSCLAVADGIAARSAAISHDTLAISAAAALAWRDKPEGSVWKGATEASARLVSMRASGG
jgi:hypothetical protein